MYPFNFNFDFYEILHGIQFIELMIFHILHYLEEKKFNRNMNYIIMSIFSVKSTVREQYFRNRSIDFAHLRTRYVFQLKLCALFLGRYLHESAHDSSYLLVMFPIHVYVNCKIIPLIIFEKFKDENVELKIFSCFLKIKFPIIF